MFDYKKIKYSFSHDVNEGALYQFKSFEETR